MSSEAEMQERINKAEGEARAISTVAGARAEALHLIGNKLKDAGHVQNAASLMVAENYVKAFEQLAKTNNTLILPSNVADISSFVTQVFFF